MKQFFKIASYFSNLFFLVLFLEGSSMATKTEEKSDTKNIEKLLNSINKVSKKEVAVNVKRDNSAIKRIVKLHGEYCQMFQMTLLKAIMTFNLTKNDILVLFGYSALMEYGNALNISQQDVGKLIQISQPNIARSVKKLKEVGIFYSTADAPRSLYIHPAFIVKGDLSQFLNEIEKWEGEHGEKKQEKEPEQQEQTELDLPF